MLISISHKKGNWIKIRMEVLRPLLAKIELIWQQPAMIRLSGVQGVASQSWGVGIGWLGLMGWSGYEKISVPRQNPGLYASVFVYPSAMSLT